MTLRWEPTKYRKRQDDEVADVDGLGRFRVYWIPGCRGYRLALNGNNIGEIYLTADEAKHGADVVVSGAGLTHKS